MNRLRSVKHMWWHFLPWLTDTTGRQKTVSNPKSCRVPSFAAVFVLLGHRTFDGRTIISFISEVSNDATVETGNKY